MPSQSSHPDHKRTHYSQQAIRQQTSPLEKIAVAVSLTAIVAFIGVDAIRTAPVDAAPIEVTFDVAPQAQWATTPQRAEATWASDDSARGTRPDSIH